MKQELTDECSYTREAQYLRLFGSPEFLGNDPRFKVPWVWEEGSTDKVLVMERVGGVSVGAVSQGQDGGLSQRDRDDVRLFSFFVSVYFLVYFYVIGDGMKTYTHESLFMNANIDRNVDS